MPYVSKKELKRIALPSDPNYWVGVDADFTYGDIKGLGKDLEGSEASDKLLLLAVKEWNIDDETGKILDLTIENINLLKKDDVVAVINKINQEVEGAAEKKPSTN